MLNRFNLFSLLQRYNVTMFFTLLRYFGFFLSVYYLSIIYLLSIYMHFIYIYIGNALRYLIPIVLAGFGAISICVFYIENMRFLYRKQNGVF